MAGSILDSSLAVSGSMTVQEIEPFGPSEVCKTLVGRDFKDGDMEMLTLVPAGGDATSARRGT